jgi:hypothetical protein
MKGSGDSEAEHGRAWRNNTKQHRFRDGRKKNNMLLSCMPPRIGFFWEILKNINITECYRPHGHPEISGYFNAVAAMPGSRSGRFMTKPIASFRRS